MRLRTPWAAQRRTRPTSRLWPIAVHFAVVMFLALGICIAAGMVLWWAADSPPFLVQRPASSGNANPLTFAEQLDLTKIMLSVVAGVGLLVTLVVAYRRQRVTEQAHEDTRHDAAERRVTELYTKAAEQIGSDKAPVRLAGMYALERLAQGNPEHRQTIVNVLCAYLRMPYQAEPVQPDRPANRPLRPGRIPARRIDDVKQLDAREEREVRLTVQRILAQHLHHPRPAKVDTASEQPETFWSGIDLDLTDATLIDLDLSNCRVRNARFAGATFSGDAEFVGATFSKGARFDEATFSGRVWFSGARFSGDAAFDATTFSDDVMFNGATFATGAWFAEATFSGYSDFHKATFAGYNAFGEAMFYKDASFREANFLGGLWLAAATFSRDAQFEGATFFTDASFDVEKFSGDVRLDGATVQHLSQHHERNWPPGWMVQSEPDDPDHGLLVRGKR